MGKIGFRWRREMASKDSKCHALVCAEMAARVGQRSGLCKRQKLIENEKGS